MKNKRFEVLITEQLLSRIYVEAETKEKALELAEHGWSNGESTAIASENMEMSANEVK
jgi:hypothetical protein